MEHLAALQEKLYAQDRWATLCVFQAMDAAGKDGTIKHVTSGVNPQGVQVTSFKAPGPEALAHDFLQRCVLRLPEHHGDDHRSLARRSGRAVEEVSPSQSPVINRHRPLRARTTGKPVLALNRASCLELL